MTSSNKRGKVSLSSRITIPSDCTFIYPLSGAASGLQLERGSACGQKILLLPGPWLPSQSGVFLVQDIMTPLTVCVSHSSPGLTIECFAGARVCPCALDFSWISIQFVSERMSVAVSGWGSVSCSVHFVRITRVERDLLNTSAPLTRLWLFSINSFHNLMPPVPLFSLDTGHQQ